jgi:hypothetical protein
VAAAPIGLGLLTIATAGATAPVLLGVLAGVTLADAAVVTAAAQRIPKGQGDYVFVEAAANMAQFEVANDKILLIDPNVSTDQGTQITAKWRNKNLRISIMLSWYRDEIELKDSAVNRENVKNALLDPKVRYVSASGHGQINELLGYTLPGDPTKLGTILKSNNIGTGELSGKIFHFIACNTGYHSPENDYYGLGENMVKNGARAFLGYKGKYAIKNRDTIINGRSLDEWFVYCDAQIDIALLDRKTVNEAYAAAIKEFNAVNKMLVDDTTANFPQAPLLLESNRDLLVIYGDGNARISD